MGALDQRVRALHARRLRESRKDINQTTSGASSQYGSGVDLRAFLQLEAAKARAQTAAWAEEAAAAEPEETTEPEVDAVDPVEAIEGYLEPAGSEEYQGVPVRLSAKDFGITPLTAGGEAQIYDLENKNPGNGLSTEKGDLVFRRHHVGLNTRDPHYVQQILTFFDRAGKAGTLEHGRIAKVYGYGLQIIDGLVHPFMVMEKIDGDTVSDYIKEDTDIETALDLTTQTLEVVASVHRQGMVHRDVKPSNLIAKNGDGNPIKVYLTDFGLARNMTDGTATGTHVGTPKYAAPEQVNDGRVTEEADVYPVGLILAELILGEEYKNSIGTTYRQVHRGRLEERLVNSKGVDRAVATEIVDFIMESVSAESTDRSNAQQAYTKAQRLQDLVAGNVEPIAEAAITTTDAVYEASRARLAEVTASFLGAHSEGQREYCIFFDASSGTIVDYNAEREDSGQIRRVLLEGDKHGLTDRVCEDSDWPLKIRNETEQRVLDTALAVIRRYRESGDAIYDTSVPALEEYNAEFIRWALPRQISSITVFYDVTTGAIVEFDDRRLNAREIASLNLECDMSGLTHHVTDSPQVASDAHAQHKALNIALTNIRRYREETLVERIAEETPTTTDISDLAETRQTEVSRYKRPFHLDALGLGTLMTVSFAVANVFDAMVEPAILNSLQDGLTEEVWTYARDNNLFRVGLYAVATGMSAIVGELVGFKAWSRFCNGLANAANTTYKKAKEVVRRAVVEDESIVDLSLDYVETAVPSIAERVEVALDNAVTNLYEAYKNGLRNTVMNEIRSNSYSLLRTGAYFTVFTLASLMTANTLANKRPLQELILEGSDIELEEIYGPMSPEDQIKYEKMKLDRDGDIQELEEGVDYEVIPGGEGFEVVYDPNLDEYRERASVYDPEFTAEQLKQFTEEGVTPAEANHQLEASRILGNQQERHRRLQNGEDVNDLEIEMDKRWDYIRFLEEAIYAPQD